MTAWLRKRWIWLRLDIALFFVPQDLKEATLERWLEHSRWQERKNWKAKYGK